MNNPQKVNWFKYVLTDEENQWDLGIILWVAGVVTFLYRGWSVSPFDFQSFGMGFGAVLAGGGALKWIRDRGKPALPQENATGQNVTANQTNSVGTPQT